MKFCLSCLLRVLLVSGALAMQSADEAAVEGLRGGDSAEVEAGVGGLGLRTEELSWDDLRGRVAGGGYRAMELGDYRRLLRECEVKGVGLAVPARPWIRRAEYEAEFRGGALTGGRLKFFLYGDEDVQREHVAPLPGLTNLRRLRLFDAHGELPLGADLERRLYVLKPGVSGDVSGTWEADGVVSGESVGFRLEFPASTTSRLELRTGADIEVTATGSLVSGRVDGAGGIIWTLIPSESARMSFVCRRSVGLATGDPVLFASFGAWHALQGDILNSRWTLGLPGGAFGGSQLSFRLSLGTRVLGVSTEDQRLLSWESVPDATAQTLRVTLPAEGLSGCIFGAVCFGDRAVGQMGVTGTRTASVAAWGGVAWAVIESGWASHGDSADDITSGRVGFDRDAGAGCDRGAGLIANVSVDSVFTGGSGLCADICECAAGHRDGCAFGGVCGTVGDSTELCEFVVYGGVAGGVGVACSRGLGCYQRALCIDRPIPVV